MCSRCIHAHDAQRFVSVRCRGGVLLFFLARFFFVETANVGDGLIVDGSERLCRRAGHTVVLRPYVKSGKNKSSFKRGLVRGDVPRRRMNIVFAKDDVSLEQIYWNLFRSVGDLWEALPVLFGDRAVLVVMDGAAFAIFVWYALVFALQPRVG